MGSLAVQEQAGTQVWRVGYCPQPWACVGWGWASEGRFPGRWDDAEGNFRTVYAGSSLLGCLLELLADFRADPLLEVDLGEIVAETLALELDAYPRKPGESFGDHLESGDEPAKGASPFAALSNLKST